MGSEISRTYTICKNCHNDKFNHLGCIVMARFLHFLYILDPTLFLEKWAEYNVYYVEDHKLYWKIFSTPVSESSLSRRSEYSELKTPEARNSGIMILWFRSTESQNFKIIIPGFKDPKTSYPGIFVFQNPESLNFRMPKVRYTVYRDIWIAGY